MPTEQHMKNRNSPPINIRYWALWKIINEINILPLLIYFTVFSASCLRTSALLTFLVLAGCENTVSWQEEVKLRTGEVTTIDREVKHVGGGRAWPQGQGTVPREHLIRFRYPPNTGQLIEWRSTKFDLPRASYAELPLVLDLDVDNSWFIYTMQWVNDYCIRYVKYEWRQDSWVEMPLSEEPIEMHETNLYLSADSNAIEGNISLGIKRQVNNSGAYLWFFNKVGPTQVTARSDGLRCEREPSTQTFKVIRKKEDKK